VPDDPFRMAPLEPEIQLLIERERSDPYGDANGVRKAALARRLEHAALAMAVTGAAPLLGIAADAAGKSLAPSVGTHAKRLLSWGLATKIGAASVLVAGGGAAGALVEAHYGQPYRPVATVVSLPAGPPPAAPAPPNPAKTPESVIPSVDVDSLPSAAASAASHTITPQPSARSLGTPMGEERLLLDTARSAIARGAYSAALASLNDAAQRFPQGKLAEERELLFVQALAGSGQSDEASARARAFEAKFPQSIFLPAVRAASGTKEP
jgi:hypothetical protein